MLPAALQSAQDSPSQPPTLTEEVLPPKKLVHLVASTKKEEIQVPSLATYYTNPTTTQYNHWFQCVCVLKFDIEIGSVIDSIYPPNILHPREEKDLTSLAFPESNSLQQTEGVLQYTFRLRHFSKLSLNATAPSEHGFSFGYTLFSQQRDPSSKRGFTQRAVVIISDMHPQIEFFYRLVGIVGSKVLDAQTGVMDVLRQVYDTVALTWPQRPLAGAKYNSLNVFGYMLELEMPPSEGMYERKQGSAAKVVEGGAGAAEEKEEQKVMVVKRVSNQDEEEGEPTKQIFVTVSKEEQKVANNNHKYQLDAEEASNQNQGFELTSYLSKQYSFSSAALFGDLLIQKRGGGLTGQSVYLLWPLWELAMTETPLMIVGEDPSECSHSVLTLMSLLAPLRPVQTVDYRPYITLYEGDTKEFSQRCKGGVGLGNTVLGVSNPYLVQYVGGQVNPPAILHLERAHFHEKKYQCPKDMELTSKCVKSFNGKLPKEVLHALVLSQKPLDTQKSTLVLKPSKIALRHLNLDKSIEESLAINNWILRQHFKEMTEVFLRAFDPYLRINFAVRGTGDPIQIKYNLTKAFKEKEFLESPGGPGTKENAFCRIYMNGNKDKTMRLYKRFVNTTIFRKWLNDKKKEIAEQELAALQQRQPQK
ncbi:hypothetical protein FGO68_gene2012 [Halteria grandinella]|uniref:UDENN domain-containing protein n=1 Tax=Halteria grandinella TaxID=5974 RepID=A0A8J8P0F4_HALGN|nr:hypothetical protein FGO68_gene2012 [Halteria grandinella]